MIFSTSYFFTFSEPGSFSRPAWGLAGTGTAHALVLMAVDFARAARPQLRDPSERAPPSSLLWESLC